MLNYHRERFRKLTFRALALRHSPFQLLTRPLYSDEGQYSFRTSYSNLLKVGMDSRVPSLSYGEPIKATCM